MATFLMKSKKYNSLDLTSPPYYMPAPSNQQNITLTEISNPTTRNPKAGRWYTNITIRSLASGQSRTYTDNDVILSYQFPLANVIVPDKMGGMYLLPVNLWGSGLNPYTYLEGVYSPFETITYNAIGDTPAKFAADGTNLVNLSLNTLFGTYIGKVNALQMQGMQAKYLKDIGNMRSLVTAFFAEAVGSLSETVTTTEAYDVRTDVTSTTDPTTSTIDHSVATPRHTQDTSSRQTPRSGTTSRTTVPRVAQNIDTFTESDGYNETNDNTNGADQWTATYNYSDTWGRGTLNYTEGYTTETTNPMGSSDTDGSVTIPAHTVRTTGTTTNGTVRQAGSQTTHQPKLVVTAVTENKASTRSVQQGIQMADSNIGLAYQSTAPNLSATPTAATLQTLLFGQFKNEVHSFMLGNINDYLNRWASIQNDLHNGRVANLFKNITLVGNYSDVNKLAGKYEVLITYLDPRDETNFDLFLDHFGHAVDEYSDQLVRDTGKNYTYTMIGEDAIIANPIKQDANPVISNQFRTGVRVWKTLIRPENY